MSALLLLAILLIVAAFLLYSIGVWGEKLVGRLKSWQLVFFWSGFVCDSISTALMREIAGKFNFDLHGLTGAAALLLMAIHAVWATLTLAMKREKTILIFHRYSLGVWTIWLIPFVSGLIMEMHR